MSAAPRAAFLFAVVLAACGKGIDSGANYTQTDPAHGIPAQSERGAPDGGGQDAGPDGGTLPDGGPFGCGPSRADLRALDGCATGNPPLLAAEAALIRSSCSNALFFVSTTATTCTGTVAGPLDAFAGQCQIANGNILDCAAPDGILPGVITCRPNNCTIRVCIVQAQDGGC